MKLSKQELEAVIAASPRSFVPLNKLVLSPTYQARPENPRRRCRSPNWPRPSMPRACCTT